MLVAVLLGLHGLLDHRGQFAVGFVAAFIRGIEVLGVRLDARQRHPPLAVGRLARSALEFCTLPIPLQDLHRAANAAPG